MSNSNTIPLQIKILRSEFSQLENFSFFQGSLSDFEIKSSSRKHLCLEYEGDLSANSNFYFKQAPSEIRFEHAKNLIQTPLNGLISSVEKILKIILLTPFWLESTETLLDQLKTWSILPLKLVGTQLTTVVLVINAIFGLIFPKNGRKLHAIAESYAFSIDLTRVFFPTLMFYIRLSDENDAVLSDEVFRWINTNQEINLITED